MNPATPINQKRIMQLTKAAIQSLEALLREVHPELQEAEIGEADTRAYEGYVRETLHIEAKPQCPECGGEMVSRVSSRGPFYGCKQYPHCQGTRPGDGQPRTQPPRGAMTVRR
jgi:hypothetical protein